MQEIKMLAISSSDLEDQSEVLPPWSDVKNSQDHAGNRSASPALSSSINVQTTKELKKRNNAEYYTSESEAVNLLVSSSSGFNFKKSVEKLSKNDKRKKITSLLYTYYPWNEQEMSLSKHALNNSAIRNASPAEQFYRDILMMRDAILYPGYDMHGVKNYYGSLASPILKKIHFILRHYGPMYKRKDKWVPFSEKKEIPLASILLHTGRLLIQLPKVREGKKLSDNFFTEFLGIKKACWRFAATHGVEVDSNPINIGQGKYKQLKEYKPGNLETVKRMKLGFTLGGHYGINLALGGCGNKHFLSQNDISNNGENGHLYLYYRPATEDTPGGLLIGIEQSASIGWSENGSILYGVPDNCGGGHSISGSSNTFTASGGTPWASKDKDEKFKDISEFAELDKFGPDKYYDAMFMNLNEADLAEITSLYKEENFDISWLAEPPVTSVGKCSGSNARLGLGNEGLFSKKKEAPPNKSEGVTPYFWSYLFP